MKLWIYLGALLAIIGMGFSIYHSGFSAGVDSEAAKQAEAVQAAVAKAKQEFEQQQAAIANIEQQSRLAIAQTADTADALAVEIADAQLTTGEQTDAPVCVDPFGAEYYRLRAAIRDGGKTVTRAADALY